MIVVAVWVMLEDVLVVWVSVIVDELVVLDEIVRVTVVLLVVAVRVVFV